METAIEIIQILGMSVVSILGFLLLLLAIKEKEYRVLWVSIPFILLYITWYVLSFLVDFVPNP